MNAKQDFDYLFKTVIVGDSSVGKTQMLSRFVDNEFSTNSKPTIGVEFGTKTIAVGKSLVKNQIWDTAGQDKYKALTCSYYRGAVGAIVVFDLSRAITFEHVQTWINEVRQNCEIDVSILLVGNKNDIQDKEVREEEIENYAMDNKLMYIPTSACTGQNIEYAFHCLMKEIVQKKTHEDHFTEKNTQKSIESDIDIPVPVIQGQVCNDKDIPTHQNTDKSNKKKDKKQDGKKIRIGDKQTVKPNKKCCQ